MPIDVGRITTEVTIADGDLPLSAAQVEKLVQAVLRKLQVLQRGEEQTRNATALRGRALPTNEER